MLCLNDLGILVFEIFFNDFGYFFLTTFKLYVLGMD